MLNVWNELYWFGTAADVAHCNILIQCTTFSGFMFDIRNLFTWNSVVNSENI